MIPQAHQRVLSGKESDFFRAYDGMLTSYQTAIGMDLTSDLTPPKELCVEVRVLPLRALHTTSMPHAQFHKRLGQHTLLTRLRGVDCHVPQSFSDHPGAYVGSP